MDANPETIPSLLNRVDRELSKTYNDLLDSVGAEDTIENDLKVVSSLSVTVSLLSILLIKVEKEIDKGGINYLTYQSKINSLRELVSALKASMYARSAKVRYRTAEIYDAKEEV